MEDVIPLQFKPTPVVSTFDKINFSSVFDPALALTPEKKVPSFSKLKQKHEFEKPIDVQGGNFLRETRVQFDQNVAVHQLSPDVSSLECSPDVNYTTDEFDEFCKISSKVSTCDFPESFDDIETNNDYHCKHQGSDIYNGTIRDDNLDILELDNSCDEPLSVLAKDLRYALDITGATNTVSSLKTKHRSNVDISSNNRVSTLDFSNSRLKPQLKSSEQVNVLSRPELNSTLILGRQVEALKNKEFDKAGILRGNVEPKLKAKIEEKALSKLNVSSIGFSDLPSLEVCEEELLNRAAEAKQSKVKSESREKAKPEGMVGRVPNILDCFSPDMIKESCSLSLFAIQEDHIQLKNCDLQRTFDAYRRKRVWEKL